MSQMQDIFTNLKIIWGPVLSEKIVYCWTSTCLTFKGILYAFGMSPSQYHYEKEKDDPAQPAFTCLKLTIQTLEQGVEYVQS